MKLGLLIVSRPLSCSILLAFAVFILPGLLIPCWFGMINQFHSHFLINNYNLQSETRVMIEETSAIFQPMSSSTLNLARFFSSSLNGTQITFSVIKTKMAPVLFEAFTVIPYLTQISYIDMDGSFFSYCTDKNGTFAVYSNSSFTAWLTQAVNPNTGKLYGKVIETHPLFTSEMSWFQEALNSSHGYATVGTYGSYDGDCLFLNMARINGSNGILSLGFSVKPLLDFLSGYKRQGESIYLVTQEGEMLVQGLDNIKMVLSGSSASFLLLKPNGDEIDHFGNVSCLPKAEKNMDNVRVLNILGTNYEIYCSSIEILSVNMVYALTFPQKESFVGKNSRVALILLVLDIVVNGIFIFTFMFMVIKATQKEMYLCVKLIQQMEATQQAERKSMNKSAAIASASHDIRAALSCITGLIGICHNEAMRGSEMETNLNQMDTCTQDLLGILNSILDTSKIEAGKVELEEEEFDLGQLLEDVADLYHLEGIKKGVNIVLDPCDGSIIKFSQVKGDRGKLKQILCNLLSNAVKFTSEGHVTLRAWVRKPSVQDRIISCHQNGLMKHLSVLFCKNKKAISDLEAMNNGVQQKPNCLELIVEVDDTGKGIPKEKHKSVFENYVQVKETTLGKGGTGLGLGIVQSLVRLMGGDIIIMDKEIGEKGTCFRFNVFLTICEIVYNDNKQEDNSTASGSTSYSCELNIKTTLSTSKLIAEASSLSSHSPNSKFAIRTSSPKFEPSRAVLLIQDDQRRKICKNFMESLGIQVSAVKQWEGLLVYLQKILLKQRHWQHNPRGNPEMSSPSECLSKSTSCDSASGIRVDVPSGATDETNYLLSIFKKTNLKCGSSFILVVIDATAGPVADIHRIMTDFKSKLHNAICQVVWLDDPMLCFIDHKAIRKANLEADDIVYSKPFHGSRLYEVIRILPEFGGTLPSNVSKLYEHRNVPKDQSLSLHQSHNRIDIGNSPTFGGKFTVVQEVTKSSNGTPMKKNMLPNQIQSHVDSKSRVSPNDVLQTQNQEMQGNGKSDKEKPLHGKKILVADDNAVSRKLAFFNLSILGATVELCENGKEALELVIKALGDQRNNSASGSPFDYILMDCKMPIMDGYEAAKHIRMVERSYNTHIPIIALTAGDEANRTIKAGMDMHLEKPLRKENLLEVIRNINNK